MAFLNFSKIVLESRYSYNFKTIFLTVIFFSWSQTDPCFENKNSWCRLSGRIDNWDICMHRYVICKKLVGQIQAVPRLSKLFSGLLPLSEIYFSHFTKSESILDFVRVLQCLSDRSSSCLADCKSSCPYFSRWIRVTPTILLEQRPCQYF